MSDAFDYYPDTDTLIVRFRRATNEIGVHEAGNFTAVTGELGDLVEIEIRGASHFVARALAEGVSSNASEKKDVDDQPQ